MLNGVDGFFVLTRIVLKTTSPPAITHNKMIKFRFNEFYQMLNLVRINNK